MRVSLALCAVVALVSLLCAPAFLVAARRVPAKSGPGPLYVPVTDPHWFWSPYNWNRQAASNAGGFTTQSNNPGAYFKTSFSGSSFFLLLNASNTPSDAYMTLRWSVDNGPWVDALLQWAQNGDTLQIANGLPQTDTPHTLVFFVLNSHQLTDRWATPLNVVRIAGAQLDAGASLSPYPGLYTKNMLVYWDSIGEGVLVNGRSNPPSDLTDNDSTRNWVQVLAQTLQVEVGAVCFGAQGWIRDGSAHAIMNIQRDTEEQFAWSRYDSKTSRLDAQGLLQPPPDLVVMGHGTNDWKSPPADVQACATAWLKAISHAAGPHAEIFLTIPFGLYHETALTAAFDDFQKGAADPRVHLVDLSSWNAQEGLQRTGAVPNKNACDALHPLAWRSAQLGGMLAEAIAEQLQDEDMA